MTDEVTELLDTAIYKEIASQALYLAGQARTEDRGARALMRELAEEEGKHAQWLKDLKEGKVARRWHREKVPNLMLSEYLTGADTLEGAGLQEVLIFALKREQESLEFYSKMMGAIRDQASKRLCQRLGQQELKHKLKLEVLYDGLFYAEN